MDRVTLLNPAAGKGLAVKFQAEARGDEVYITRATGDCADYVEKRCTEKPNTHFFVYGGDGTICETVSGIIRAGAGDSARITVVPTGTGNDFVRHFKDKSGEFQVDVMKLGDTYAVNMLNIGFDCDVVSSVAKMKRIPLVSGSASYFLGVADILLHRLGRRMTVTYTAADGSRGSIDREFLLVAVGNGGWCGGGFYANPCARYDDGLIELITVDKISRRTFISMISDYRKGTHIVDPACDIPQVIDRFKPFFSIRRVRSVSIDGMKQLCADGEVTGIQHVDVSVLPRAVTFVF